MSREGKSPIEKGEEKVRKAKTLYDVLDRIPDSLTTHRYFQHYTTLDRLLEKISTDKWYLSCCTSDRLNDHIECAKYGDYREARRMYQTCFCHGTGESVAMWGLYQCSKPCAVRITLPAESVRKWLDELVVKHRARVCHKFVRDLAYIAVGNGDCADDEYDIPRCNCARWERAITKQIPNLAEEVREGWTTGLIKDYEWRHERETRLVVELEKHVGNGVAVTIPHDVLENMRFTFSPWLKPQIAGVAANLIMDALTKRLKKEPKALRQRFRRSSLTGGLNIGDGRVPCAFCDTCRLFGRGECHGQ